MRTILYMAGTLILYASTLPLVYLKMVAIANNSPIMAARSMDSTQMVFSPVTGEAGNG